MNTVKDFKEYLQSKIEGKFHYYQAVGAFDIETTKYTTYEGKTANYCYAWSFSVDGILFTFGRDPEDFFKFLKQLNLQKKLIIYVQWLGYEYCNLMWLFDKYITNDDKNIHLKYGNIYKPLKIEGNKVIFKCSNALSGMSLAHMGEEIGIPKSKDLDYEVPRNRETPMTADEIGYCLRDVEIVCKWILNAVNVLGCKINELPITAAGMYNKALDDIGWNEGVRIKWAQNKYETWQDGDYNKFHEAFRGGLITYNEKYYNKFVENVIHADIKSAYPAVQVFRKLPKKFSHSYSVFPKEKQERMIYNYNKWAVLAKFTFVNLIIKSTAPCFINGIIYKEKYTQYMTNLEFAIFAMYYDFDSVVWEDFQASELELLPQKEIAVNLKLFEEKEKAKDTKAYGIKKVQLNSGFGNKCKRMVVAGRGRNELEWNVLKTNSTKEIGKLDYYYPIGVWISAVQRFIMADIIYKLGQDFIYCNTDGLYCKNTEHSRKILEQYNETIPHVKLGKFEMKEIYKFYIVGPSRYAVIDKDDNVDITFSGTDKKDQITLEDLHNYAIGGGFIISNGAYKPIYGKRDNYIGMINGIEVITHNFLIKQPSDMEISKESEGLNWYMEDK